ncbi:MAG: hypothetical protein ACXWH0_15905, partial [Acidimicrobiia bacterium]
AALRHWFGSTRQEVGAYACITKKMMGGESFATAAVSPLPRVGSIFQSGNEATSVVLTHPAGDCDPPARG